MNILGGAFKIGQLFDINIRVHFLFLIWIGFELLSSGMDYREGLFLAMLFGIVLVHEFGHCFGARSVGGDAHDIVMWPLGGLAYAYAPMTPWAQFVTVAAGPAVNVVFCIASGIFIVIQQQGHIGVLPINPLAGFELRHPIDPWMIWVLTFYRVNLFLLAFNLLPIYPLDGGQLFMTAIWPFLGLHRATQIACQVGIGGAVVLAFLGLQGGGGGILFFIAIFGGLTCWQRLQALRYGMIMDESPRYTVRNPRRSGPGFFSRLFGGMKRRGGGGEAATPTNPNPGGWERKRTSEEKLEQELDRILKKVHEEGVASLSYTERQTLERARRDRQRREREIDEQTRL